MMTCHSDEKEAKISCEESKECQIHGENTTGQDERDMKGVMKCC